jgi:periplasmic divalent cation tolerance protein
VPTKLIYVTTSDRDEARRIGRTLVEERLVACVNILDGMESMYWWHGAIQEATEAVLIGKTREDLVASVVDRVKELHSYECPCVVSLPIEDGNLGFLGWIDEETAANRPAEGFS